MIWIALALLSIAAMLPLWISIEREPRAPGRRAAALALHREQLAELEGSLGADGTGEGEHASAVIDVQRQLLASAGEREEELRRGTKMPLLVALGAVPAIALALYLTNGSPNLPSVPGGSLVAEGAPSPEAVTRMLAKLRDRATSLPANSAEARSAYIALGKAEADQGDMPAAADAWNAALAIHFDPTLAAATAEALSESAGHVDARAAALFQRALASAPANAPWRPMVMRRLAEAKAETDAGSRPVAAGN
jgi:cytochrome c-type biogenesis protein CcmH